MLKVFKYLFLANLYRKAKKSFVMLAVYIISLVLLSFIFNDLIGVATGMVIYVLIFVKWIFILALLTLIAFTLLKIFSHASSPFENKDDEKIVDSKKTRILSKEILSTKSDLILQKYMKYKTNEV